MENGKPSFANPAASVQRITQQGEHGPRFSNDYEKDADFEHILELSRLATACFRKNAVCSQHHVSNLTTKEHPEGRLRELDRWQASMAFTEREKAALRISESFSFHDSREMAEDVLREARYHFDTSEMVRLTLAIMAVNDWIDMHSEPSKRVLVVEDSPADQELLQYQLRKSQMAENVVFVSDALRALDLLTGPESKTFRQDLIAVFLDIGLPGMSGIEFLRKIRTMPKMEDLPVIIMTSSSDPRHMEECKRLKVAGYVKKPVTFDSFSKAVANIFHQKTAA